jgi:pyruvate dehydrogenase E1 component alpha subunit
VDGVNVLAVYDATAVAVERARSGGGPTFIEAPVYRFRAHGGAGDDSHTGYRAITEREHWEPYDPIALFEHFLRAKRLLDDSAIAGMERRIAAEIAEAFEHALASPNPTEDDLYRHVYAD